MAALQGAAGGESFQLLDLPNQTNSSCGSYHLRLHPWSSAPAALEAGLLVGQAEFWPQSVLIFDQKTLWIYNYLYLKTNKEPINYLQKHLSTSPKTAQSYNQKQENTPQNTSYIPPKQNTYRTTIFFLFLRPQTASSQSSVVLGQCKHRTVRPLRERVCRSALAAQLRQRSWPQSAESWWLWPKKLSLP